MPNPVKQEDHIRNVKARGKQREVPESHRVDTFGKQRYSGVLISPSPDLLPDVFCLMVRIFRLMLVL